jgi:2-phosphosulfolactate phosphatase
MVEELYFANRLAVTIDVLRATSTIVTAIMHGAKEVVPVGSLDFSKIASASSFGGRTMRGGEKNSKKIEGFDLGNSPLEYQQNIVEGKSIVFFTTNGSKAIVKTKYGSGTFICSFLNIKAVATQLAGMGREFDIVCSGMHGDFSLEDTVCAGMLLTEILKINKDFVLSDASTVAIDLFEKYGNDIRALYALSEHGRILETQGFSEDLDYCAQKDITDVIPIFESSAIKLFDPLKHLQSN